jgi:hypothetical protein
MSASEARSARETLGPRIASFGASQGDGNPREATGGEKPTSGSSQTDCITQGRKRVHSRGTYRHAFALSAENMTADMTLSGVVGGDGRKRSVPVLRAQIASKTYPSELARTRINGGVPTVTSERARRSPLLALNGRFGSKTQLILNLK